MNLSNESELMTSTSVVDLSFSGVTIVKLITTDLSGIEIGFIFTDVNIVKTPAFFVVLSTSILVNVFELSVLLYVADPFIW